jgi:hypothetical protein
MVTIGYRVKFTNWTPSHNEYNFVNLQDAKDFIAKHEKYGYKAQVNAINAQESVSVVA